jgi:hypothetical protein
VVLQLVERRHEVVLQADQRFALGQLLDEVLPFSADREHVGDVVVEIAAEGVVANQRIVESDARERGKLQAVLLEEGLAWHDHDVFPRLSRSPGRLGRLLGLRVSLPVTSVKSRSVARLGLVPLELFCRRQPYQAPLPLDLGPETLLRRLGWQELRRGQGQVVSCVSLLGGRLHPMTKIALISEAWL